MTTDTTPPAEGLPRLIAEHVAAALASEANPWRSALLDAAAAHGIDAEGLAPREVAERIVERARGAQAVPDEHAAFEAHDWTGLDIHERGLARLGWQARAALAAPASPPADAQAERGETTR